jgi:predicted ATP-grasp superfamily ATP-dependent carboligase
MARTRVLIAGVSTRAMTESAVRAGYDVSAIDAFGDLDHQAGTLISFARDLGARYNALVAARVSRTVPADAVAYASNFENHPRAVALLAQGRSLWGNAPVVLAHARNPIELARTLRRHGLPAVDVRASPPRAPAAHHRRWLVKPRASGGGHGIAPWHPGDPLSRRQVIQQRLSGIAASLVFCANGEQAVPFGFSRLLAGDPAFGAKGWTYCGNILGRLPRVSTSEWQSVLGSATRAAQALTVTFGLRGVNGLDCIVSGGAPFVIELNPRYTASMELAVRTFGFSFFQAHARSCAAEPFPFDMHAALRGAPGTGKAVLYARHDAVMADTRSWLDDPSVRDVPHPGEHIQRGRPICTIFAEGRSSASCYAALVRRAQKLYHEMDSRRGVTA